MPCIPLPLADTGYSNQYSLLRDLIKYHMSKKAPRPGVFKHVPENILKIALRFRGHDQTVGVYVKNTNLVNYEVWHISNAQW